MCWIAVFFRVTPHYPVIVAANREESRRRPSQAPLRWASEPPIWAGRDELGGGTWLGVNASGLLAALTNRPGDNDDVTRPSRGLLCLGSLRCDSPRSARAFFVDALAVRTYNPFNLLCVSPIEGWVGTQQGAIRELAPGLHILSNDGEIDDDRIPLVREARRRVESVNISSPVIDDLFRTLGRVCALTNQPIPLCRVGGDHGTVSSSLVALQADGTVAAYWHAPGPPSACAFVPVDVSPKSDDT